MRLTGYLRYASPIAGTTGDDIVMIVVPWEQGPHSGVGVWIVMVPETAPQPGH